MPIAIDHTLVRPRPSDLNQLASADPGAIQFTAHALGGYQAFFFRDLNGVPIEVGQVS